jgi:hypothetical protein
VCCLDKCILYDPCQLVFRWNGITFTSPAHSLKVRSPHHHPISERSRVLCVPQQGRHVLRTFDSSAHTHGAHTHDDVAPRGALGIPLSSTGTLPAGIGNLTNLQQVHLSNTKLSGAVSTPPTPSPS